MREELDHRPMVVAFLGLAVGASAFLNPWLGLLLVPLLAGAKRWGVRAVAIAGFLAAYALFPRVDTTPVADEAFYEGPVEVITMPVSTANSLRCVAARGHQRFLLYVPGDSGVVLGDRLKVRAEVLPFREGMLDSHRSCGVMKAISAPLVLERGSPVWRWGLWVRQSFRALTFRHADPGAGPLLDGMCFSMTAEIPVELRQAMSKTGTTHIVSTSGLHVVLATFALAFVVGAFPVPRWAQVTLMVALLAVYAAAAGLQPPIVRSVLMMLALFSAYMVRRGFDGLSALGFAGSLSLLWAPELVQDIGFQLSVVAVGSLMLFARAPDVEAFSLRDWALRYFEASLVVTLFTAPLLAYHFGTVPLMSIPANMLVVPVLGVVIASALASWALWLVVPAVGVGLLKVSVEPMTGWIGYVVQNLGSLPFASFAVPEFSAWWLLPVYGVGMLVWRPHVRAI